MKIGSFAMNTFNIHPPVLQKKFWTNGRDIGKKLKIRDCIMVKFNQINMKNRFFFLRFHKKRCILVVLLRMLSIGPPVLQKQFWTNKRDIGKNQKSGIVLWSSSIKSTRNFMFLFFVSAKRMHIDSFAQNAFNRCPQYSRSSFGPIKEISEKIKNHGLFYGQFQSNQSEK